MMFHFICQITLYNLAWFILYDRRLFLYYYIDNAIQLFELVTR